MCTVLVNYLGKILLPTIIANQQLMNAHYLVSTEQNKSLIANRLNLSLTLIPFKT